MDKFEEQLLSDLMREHGPELDGVQRPRRRSTKPAWIAAGAVAVAGVAAGALLWPTAAPAAAVTNNGDGTVTVSVKNAGAVDEVNKELQDKQVPMRLQISADGMCEGLPIVVELDQTLDATVRKIEIGDGNPIYRLESRPDGSITVRLIGCDSRNLPTK